MEPVVDIIVPTYNRHRELGRFFQQNLALSQLAVHIWVIDDCSSPAVDNLIPSWGNITFIRLDRNSGQAAARNVAIARGNAPVVISLDDDAWFENAAEAIRTIVDLFNRFTKAGCVMFNIATPTSSYSNLPTGTKLPLHITCGCAYRREVLDLINGFSGFLHSQAEETDLSLRIYRESYEIVFCREIRVFHNFVPGARPVSWYLQARHNTTRNDLLIVWMYFPIALIIPGLLYKFLSHLRFAFRNRVTVFRAVWYTLRAGFSFIVHIPAASRLRSPLGYGKWKSWYQLQRAYLGKKN